VWVEGNQNRAGQKLTWAELWAGVKKRVKRGAGGRRAGAEWWAEITEISFNTEQQNSPLRSTPMLCTEVIESVLRKSQPASYIIVYSHKVQSDSTTIRQSYLICWNATVLAFRLWPTTFTRASFWLQTICRSSGTTTALVSSVHHYITRNSALAVMLPFCHTSKMYTLPRSFYVE